MAANRKLVEEGKESIVKGARRDYRDRRENLLIALREGITGGGS